MNEKVQSEAMAAAFGARNVEELESQYARWAAGYDAENAAAGFRLPARDRRPDKTSARRGKSAHRAASAPFEGPIRRATELPTWPFETHALNRILVITVTGVVAVAGRALVDMFLLS